MSVERRGSVPRSQRTISNAERRQLRDMYRVGAIKNGEDLTHIKTLSEINTNGQVNKTIDQSSL